MQPGHLDQFYVPPRRILIAQALTEFLPILSADRIFASYGIKLAIREPFSASHYDENEGPQDNASQIPGYRRCA
jgi:hypothetical protein